MAVENVGEKYRCNVCGNEVTVTKVGGGTLVCCNQEMEKTALGKASRAPGGDLPNIGEG